MAFDDPALLAEFVAESREHLAEVEGQLLEIEAGGADIDVDLVNTVFRAIHSIKGAAGFMGLTTINQLGHSLENVLGKMRNCELVPTKAIVDVMLRAADTLSGLINDIEASNDVDVTSQIAELDQINEAKAAAEPSAKPSPQPSAKAEEAVESAGYSSTSDAPGDPLTASATNEQSVPPADTPAAPQDSPGEPQTTRSSTPAVAAESSIRVQVGVLDSLMNIAGELVLGRNQLLQTISAQDHTGIETVGARLDQVTSELQEAIMQTRMQPIGNVFNKFPRVVRDLSAKLGKHIDVVMEGKEVEVDKTIIEAIGDPLTHLVRNSVDHGVEAPEARTRIGKKREGTITLKAYHRAGKVRIDITDDGGGIDTNKLKQKAIAKGIISQDAAADMPEREALHLIFHPGFSTAEKVSDVSGRGVGMDVVRTNIEKIGGTVDVESQIGSGTSIQITLPLTLAIIPSMVVRCQKERFAIPQVNIVELVWVKKSEASERINRIKGAQVLRLRGSLLPLIELDRAFDMAPDDEDSDQKHEAQHIIVLESGTIRYGLVVDGIDDSEEIVVKPLGRHLKLCKCLAGATILGDGHVAPILDVSGIADRCELQSTFEEVASDQNAQTTDALTETQTFLLFSNCPAEQFAVPMSLISRIERIEYAKIEGAGGREFLQYRESTLPLISVEHFITAEPRVQSEHVHVVVFQVRDREVGLVAPQLNDICEVVAAIDGETFREPGVAGSLVIEENTTRLLDLYELTHHAFPQWFVERPHEHPESSEDHTVLLAEDSTFFRRQVKGFFEEEGLCVVEAEDGQEAWDKLTSGEHNIDLVVTDIEMPNMNGFELSRRINDDPSTSHLPIIAVTSLASDEDRQRGLESGVDEYQVKIDRESLIAAVWRILQRRKSMTPTFSNGQKAELEECLV